MTNENDNPIVSFWHRINETDSKSIDKGIRDKKAADAKRRINQDRGRYEDDDN